MEASCSMLAVTKNTENSLWMILLLNQMHNGWRKVAVSQEYAKTSEGGVIKYHQALLMIFAGEVLHEPLIHLNGLMIFVIHVYFLG